MRRAVHLIDADTPGDLLDQLRLLAGEAETVVSVGPPPRHAPFTLPVAATHRPLNSPALCGWRMRNLANEYSLLHAWSPAAARAAEAIARTRNVSVLRSLAHVPDKTELKALLRSMRKRGVHVTVPTSAARRALLHAGAPSHAVHVLPPPADEIDDVQGRRTRTRKALGLSDRETLLVTTAEMTRWAGHKYASWAHAILRQVLPDFRLLLPGGGPAEPQVRFFAATTGYDSEVFFTGDRFRPADALAAADIVLFFCERDRGVAALVSAMAAGAAIAASHTPDVAECAPHEQAAVLSQPGDPRSASAAVLRLREEPGLAQRLGRSARQRADEYFARGDCRRRLEEIYEAAAASAPA